MNLCVSSRALWKQLWLVVLIFLGISAWGTDNSYGMAIATSGNNIENLITNTSGLTPQEETLLVGTIEGIISTTKRFWYPDSFSPTDNNITYSNALDMQQVTKLQTLADTGMQVIKMVDERLQGVQEERRRRKGRWGFLENIDDIPYRISTNSPVLVFEIRKYDCLNKDGAYLPSNASTDVPNSVWMQYTDSVYVPFNCPSEYDFDRERAAKEHQRLMARLSRSKRSSGDPGSSGQSTIFQVNLTITNETFQKTLYNQKSSDYITMTKALTKLIDGIFNFSDRYMGVNDFSYRPGSVIATFHIEVTGSNSISFVRIGLENATVNGIFGEFMVNLSLLDVGQFLFENAHYSQWGNWGTCNQPCGIGYQSRSRSCNSSAPLACAHEGPSVETQKCYIKYCPNECSAQFTGDRGSFSSPVIDGLYPRDADCVWQITVDENHTIVVQFEDFNLEKDKKCKYDYVAFYDGNYSKPADYRSRELLRFCGNSTPPHSYPPYGYPVNSSSNAITVHFKTDSTKERLGFTAIWHKVLKYHLRIPKIKPQAVTVLSFIYNPWSTMKDAAIPLGKATTCPESWGDDSCYFFGKHNVISRMISVFLSRDMEITTSDPILIKFEHILDETMFPLAYTGRKTCVTWDHTIKSPSLGAWTKRGCSTSFSNLTHTMCKCLHTGVFAVLGAMEPPLKDLKIKANIYFGCAVFLILVIATVHSLATKDKKTTGELFHLFEAIVSGILMVIFITGAHVPAQKELCGFLAFFLYYLVLSQFTWMTLTVFWMQNFLKRFLADRVRIKIVYFVLGWGIPLILAGVAGKINVDKNGHEDNVCWVSISGAGTVWGYGAPVFAMFIVSVVILVYLLLPASKEKCDYDKIRPRVFKEILVMVSFILTWCLGVKVTHDDSFKNQYFFSMFLILQGALNLNICHESTELFWKEEEVKKESEGEKEENKDSSDKDKIEESEETEKENKQPRMTVKTLKNLNIYKENGVFVIEA